MPTYVYETIPETPEEQPELFEIQQSMRDAALKRHPENGKRIQRVITGGFGLMGTSTPSVERGSGSTGCGSGGCGCH